MAGCLLHCAFNLNSRAASNDTPLRSQLEFAHVDHAHPGAIIALAVSPGSEAAGQAIFATARPVLPVKLGSNLSDQRWQFLQMLFQRDRIIAHAHAGGVVNSIGDSRAYTAQAQFPHCRFPLRSDPVFPSRIDPGDVMSRRAGFGSSW